jgi:hypothetical protein
MTKLRPRGRHTINRARLRDPMESLPLRDPRGILPGHTTSHLRDLMESLRHQGHREKRHLRGCQESLRRRGLTGNRHLHGHRERHHLPGHTASPHLLDPMTSPTPHRGLKTDPRRQADPTTGPTTGSLSMRCLEGTVSPARGLHRLGRTRTRRSHSRGPRTRALGLRRLTLSTRGRSKTAPSPTAQHRTQDPRAMRPMVDHLRRRLSRCPDLPRCRCRRLERRAMRPLSRTSNLALRRPWSCRRKMSSR